MSHPPAPLPASPPLQLPQILSPSARSHLPELKTTNAAIHPDPALIRHFQSLATNPDTPGALLPPGSDPTTSPATPVRRSDCCLSLSPTLLGQLLHILPAAPSLTLSVGSGSGLLERALQLSSLGYSSTSPSPPPLPDPEFSDSEAAPPGDRTGARSEPGPSFRPGLAICGVEVSPRVNRYLRLRDLLVVRGSWDLPGEEVLGRAGALLFVYPRMKGLVEGCLERWAWGRAWSANRDGGKGVVVWLGPVADWEDGGFGDVVRGWAGRNGGSVEERRGAEMGVMEGEMGVVVRRDGAEG